jgi:hypothetical protein
MLFGIGAHLAELGENLKRDDGGAERARSLRSHFADLRRAVDDRSPWMAKSAVARFCEELRELAAGRAEFSAQCGALEAQLDLLLQRCRDDMDSEDDVPF